jgi:excisionase family DNA binding protein
MADELLLTIDEASRRLGMCRSVVYRFIRSGDLLSMKIGGSRRVLVSDLEDFVKRLRGNSNA